MLQLLHIELWAEACALPIELSDMAGIPSKVATTTTLLSSITQHP